jgi:aspartyl-tRNA(Asn)/glutamyl-tRNA(Gln) amidotransferase subunit A
MAMRDAATSPIIRRDVSDLHAFVPETFVMDDLDDAVAANFEAAVAALEKTGARIERGPCPIFTDIAALTVEHGGLSSAEAYATYRDILDGPDAARVDRRVVARMMPGKTMPAHSLLTIQQARARLQGELAALLDGRMMLMPTTPNTAPEIAPMEADDDVFHRTNLRGLRNTLMGNFLNTPGVAMPTGMDAGGLPTSILISSIANDDERMLGFAYAVERAIA